MIGGRGCRNHTGNSRKVQEICMQGPRCQLAGEASWEADGRCCTLCVRQEAMGKLAACFRGFGWLAWSPDKTLGTCVKMSAKLLMTVECNIASD